LGQGQDSGVSAFAADRQISSMNDRAAKSSLPSITARPSAADKARFTLLAPRVGMSESALALLAIRQLLEPEATTPATNSVRVAASDRITIRLRPGDGVAIARRASERGMNPSGYLAALVRAHLTANPSRFQRARGAEAECCRPVRPWHSARSDGPSSGAERPSARGCPAGHESHTGCRCGAGAADSGVHSKGAHQLGDAV
jgi:predicted DNA binding CopG/RHH family protein